ncbi:MAG TPA: class E sortase [Acidimicrobiia bacterium]|nr:class E sortase [Acidimicrobiia bacterium]
MSEFQSDPGSPVVAPPQPERRRVRPLRWIGARLPEGVTERVLVVGTITAVLVVGGSTLAIVKSSPRAKAAVDAPLFDATTTTTQPPTSTTQTAAPAPYTRPIDPPRNPVAATPLVKIGEIQIPKIGLVHPIYEGVTLTVIDHGPGHWPGSAMPGQFGNAVFAGHRVTHTHPFLRINELVPGDQIIFKMANGTFTYSVTGHQIVTPKDVHIVDPTPDATLTLFACHPPHQAIQRYVVRAAFVSASPV